MAQLRRAAIVSPIRTPVGRFLGTLTPLEAGPLAAHIIEALVLSHTDEGRQTADSEGDEVMQDPVSGPQTMAGPSALAPPSVLDEEPREAGPPTCS